MDKNTYIIAEMAWSHNGSLNTAIKIMKGAVKSGANAIGIHITDLPSYMTRNYKCLVGKTLSETDSNNVSIYQYLEKINLSNEDWLKFSKIANNFDIDLVVMCNDINSYEFSKLLKVKYYVISAASFVEYDLIEAIAKDVDKIFLRIGGATLNEIESVVNFIYNKKNTIEIVLLCGIQLYPTPISQLYIKSITSIKEYFKNYKRLSIGLADHISGDDPLSIYLPALALPLGVTVFEKHITTIRKEKLEDFEAALGIKEFKKFVEFIKSSQIALGDGSIEYIQNDYYTIYRKVVRKKIVANVIINDGEILTRDKIAFKRSDSGLEIESLNEILNKKVIGKIYKDEGITFEKIQQ